MDFRPSPFVFRLSLFDFGPSTFDFRLLCLFVVVILDFFVICDFGFVICPLVSLSSSVGRALRLALKYTREARVTSGPCRPALPVAADVHRQVHKGEVKTRDVGPSCVFVSWCLGGESAFGAALLLYGIGGLHESPAAGVLLEGEPPRRILRRGNRPFDSPGGE